MNDTMMIRNPETSEWESVYLPPTGDTFPVGSVSAYAGENIPTNWLRCDGQEVSRTEYAELFKAIGTTYGAGDSSTTFNLPDLNTENRTIVGSSGDGEFSLGNTGGEKEHTLTLTETPEHIIETTKEVSGGASDGYIMQGSYNKTNTYNVGGTSKPHNNMQPYIALNYIIKAKQSVGIVGTVTDDINDTNDNAVANAKTVKNYVDNTNTYSTDEIEIGKWIDGNPFYRKVITLSDLRTDTYIQIEVASNALIKKYEGYIQRANGASLDDLTLSVRSSKKIEYKIDSVYLNNLTGAYVIVYYTKTTD